MPHSTRTVKIWGMKKEALRKDCLLFDLNYGLTRTENSRNVVQ